MQPKVPFQLNKCPGGCESCDLRRIFHSSNDARFDTAFSDHQVTVQTVYDIGELASVAQLRRRKDTFDDCRTGCIVQSNQPLAPRADRT